MNDLLLMKWYSFRKGVGVCNALLDITQSPQLAFDAGSQSKVILLDFSLVSDKANH